MRPEVALRHAERVPGRAELRVQLDRRLQMRQRPFVIARRLELAAQARSARAARDAPVVSSAYSRAAPSPSPASKQRIGERQPRRHRIRMQAARLRRAAVLRRHGAPAASRRGRRDRTSRTAARAAGARVDDGGRVELLPRLQHHPEMADAGGVVRVRDRVVVSARAIARREASGKLSRARWGSDCACRAAASAPARARRAPPGGTASIENTTGCTGCDGCGRNENAGGDRSPRRRCVCDLQPGARSPEAV